MGTITLPFRDVANLAPGDQKSVRFDWSDFQIWEVTSEGHPIFESAYSKLWNEFGAKGEMEQRDIILKRLRAGSWRAPSGLILKYQMIAVLSGADLIAVRDHTAVIDSRPGAVVHLSHILIDPPHRGSGLSGWMRAWPIDLARAELKAAGHPETSPVTLVAEMEPLDPSDISKVARLRSYESASFKMVDPSVWEYLQPDFRSPAEIDADGKIKPVRLNLVIRRVGKETESQIDGRELRQIVHSIYTMYESAFRPQDMKPLWDRVTQGSMPASMPSDDTRIRLLRPTELP